MLGSALVATTTTVRRLAVRQYTVSGSNNFIVINAIQRRSARISVQKTDSFAVIQQPETSPIKTRWLSSTASAPSANEQPLRIQLYQYAICPFCNRVKALLDYTGVEYGTTEVNPLTKAEIKPWKDQYSKVPIATVITPTEKKPSPIFGSDVIVNDLLKEPAIQSKLQERWKNSKNGTMNLETFRNGPNVQKWSDFAVNDLAALLYPNMCRTWWDSYRAFDYVHTISSFGPLQRFMIQSVGSLAMFFAATKVKKKRNIADERQALEDVLSRLEKELESKQFLSGTGQPDMGDLTVFGTLRSIEGLPVHDSLVRERKGPIPEWYDRMTKQVSSSYRQEPTAPTA